MAKQKSHRVVIMIGSIASMIMFGFSFAIVPFYSMICKATGINTSVPVAEWGAPAKAGTLQRSADMTRTITVQFLAANHMGMPWDFYPKQPSVEVHPGESVQVYFYAKNTTSNTMTVQAIPSMTPTEAIGHFHKIQCFCFNQQTLKAGESKNMGLRFQVDKDLPKDIRTITLAYTLFDVTPNETRKG